MDRYPLKKKLKDGTEVTIREMIPEDEEKSLAFFRSLPEEQRQYLRMDVTQVENIKQRMTPGPFLNCWRIVAEKDDAIWADATLCSKDTGWMRHTSEIRCIIHQDVKRNGLGSIMLWELFQRALSEGTHMVYCLVLPKQSAAIAVLDKLGFHKALVRPQHVKDLKGNKHDLHVYVKDVKEMWDTLKSYMDSFDFDISVRH